MGGAVHMSGQVQSPSVFKTEPKPSVENRISQGKVWSSKLLFHILWSNIGQDTPWFQSCSITQSLPWKTKPNCNSRGQSALGSPGLFFQASLGDVSMWVAYMSGLGLAGWRCAQLGNPGHPANQALSREGAGRARRQPHPYIINFSFWIFPVLRWLNPWMLSLDKEGRL